MCQPLVTVSLDLSLDPSGIPGVESNIPETLHTAMGPAMMGVKKVVALLASLVVSTHCSRSRGLPTDNFVEISDSTDDYVYWDWGSTDFYQVKLTDTIILKHNPVSLKNIQRIPTPSDMTLEYGQNIIYIIVEDRLLESFPDWVRQLSHEVELDRTCCSFHESHSTRAPCQQHCRLPTLPFLVAMEHSSIPVIIGGLNLKQNIFTYCCLTHETSQNMKIERMSHQVSAKAAYSKVTVSNFSQTMAGNAFYLFQSPNSRPKRVMAMLADTVDLQLMLGHRRSLTKRIVHYGNDKMRGICNVSVERGIQTHGFQKVFYSCKRSDSPVATDFLSTHNIDVKQYKNRFGYMVDYDLMITASDENSFGTYDCILKRERTSLQKNPKEVAVGVKHLATINLKPQPWKDQAKYFFQKEKDSSASMSSVIQLFSRTSISLEEYVIFYKAWFEVITLIVAAVVLFLVICIIYRHLDAKARKNTLAFAQGRKKTCTGKQPQYKYDVFLSYSSVDRAWVENKLLCPLEREGYSVCYDQRYEDFPCGQPILKSIEKAIRHSRKTLVVFSPDYLSSNWTNFELMMVYTGILDGDLPTDSLVVVKYRPCKIPYPLYLRTYNDWTNPEVRGTWLETVYSWLPYFLARKFHVTLEEEERKRFWDGLVNNIGGVRGAIAEATA